MVTAVLSLAARVALNLLSSSYRLVRYMSHVTGTSGWPKLAVVIDADNVLRHQAASYRRAPNTVPEVLVLLQRTGVPKFAAEVRHHLGPPAW